MAPPSARSTEILTEHLGFPPIALIDDIINAVNGVMYKCTQAVETYLHDKQSSSDETVSNEIEVGTAKLETLLENSVDRNFDKFELYALRNILTIPNDLTDSGLVTLRHHQGVKFDKKADVKSVELDLKLNQAFKEITQQLVVKKQLVLQMNKAKKILKLLTLYKDAIHFLSDSPNLSKDAMDTLKTLAPLDQTLYYLVSQTSDMFDTINTLQQTFTNPVTKGGINGLGHSQSDRDRYLNVETTKLLRILGLAKNRPRVEKLLEDLDNVDLGNAEIQKALKEKFGI
ncbi:CYFA0S02e10506g1_1 [Cyberlindnera fabianii]|uniref:CYFA0S02e10506g1_1 n=1 Tax=Cyberlindnera fabianii TaxID=36022 RepID=A0A061AUJ4_CYBFA|nr:CYFA0S02e10506g1_1 [Cyberlindnera fabianii]